MLPGGSICLQTKTSSGTHLKLETVSVDEDNVCSSSLLSTQPVTFLFGHCSFPLVELKPLVPCCRAGHTSDWATLSIPDVEKQQAFLPE